MVVSESISQKGLHPFSVSSLAALMLLDLSSAFDTVDHDILLHILQKRFEILDTPLSWLNSYLSDRTQSFMYAQHLTPAYRANCSVPQGSVLGFQQFVTYTDDAEAVFNRGGIKCH